MKKILFVIPSFSIGGTTSSLEAFLSLIDKERVQPAVFALNQSGVRKEAFQEYQILPESIWLSSKIVNCSIMCRLCHKVLQIVNTAVGKIGVKLFSRYAKRGAKILGLGQYDIVIAYVESVARNVAYYPVNQRFVFIRSEFSRHFSLCDKQSEKEAFLRFDKIIGVSEFARRSFVKVIPELKERAVAIPNVIDSNAIRVRSEEKMEDPEFNTDFFTIISIGRMDPVKQFDQIPAIAKQIAEHTGPTFRWYIIGGGDDKIVNPVKEEIRQMGLDRIVFCLGEKRNIYPYLKKASLLVHTSKSETFSRVVNDAKILGIPVVVNNYECAPEFLINGKEGVIAPNKEMSPFIIKMIQDIDYYNHFKKALSDYKYNNEDILERFYSICEI